MEPTIKGSSEGRLLQLLLAVYNDTIAQGKPVKSIPLSEYFKVYRVSTCRKDFIHEALSNGQPTRSTAIALREKLNLYWRELEYKRNAKKRISQYQRQPEQLHTLIDALIRRKTELNASMQERLAQLVNSFPNYRVQRQAFVNL